MSYAYFNVRDYIGERFYNSNNRKFCTLLGKTDDRSVLWVQYEGENHRSLAKKMYLRQAVMPGL